MVNGPRGLVGFEAVLGKKILDDPRSVEAFRQVKEALENYDRVIELVAKEITAKDNQTE